MREDFNSTADETEALLMSWGLRYTREPGGVFRVPNDLHLVSQGLTELPDLSRVILEGNFHCSGNKLTSLKGAPRSVGGHFWCDNNLLTSLEGAPAVVEGDFNCVHNRLKTLKGGPRRTRGFYYCEHNELASLEHGPQSVGTGFSCGHNRLTSLKDGPLHVGMDYFCHNNQLTSLEGAPAHVLRYFYAHTNKLTSLEGAPQIYERLQTDLGTFTRGEAIPEKLRVSPETKARKEREKREAAEKLSRARGALQDSMRQSKTGLKLPPRPPKSG
jgi:hypothetical protein